MEPSQCSRRRLKLFGKPGGSRGIVETRRFEGQAKQVYSLLLLQEALRLQARTVYRTVANILKIMTDIQIAGAERAGEAAVEAVKEQTKVYEQFMELISVDTLKTMQLIGFNYKTAIGEPLTLMLKNFLLSKVKEPDSVSMFEKVLTPELVEILKDDTAYENFRGILGGESND